MEGKKGFIFQEITSNLFSFQFSEAEEKDRILKNDPWSFDKALLVLRKPGLEQEDEIHRNNFLGSVL